MTYTCTRCHIIFDLNKKPTRPPTLCPKCRHEVHLEQMRKGSAERRERNKAKMKEHSKRNNAEIKGQGAGFINRQPPPPVIERDMVVPCGLIDQAKTERRLKLDEFVTRVRYPEIHWMFGG